MSHLSASLPVVQYLHYHTKHCPLNPSEASLSLDGVLLSQPTMCFERNASKQRSSLLFYIFYHFLFLFYSFLFLFIYVFRICISTWRSVFCPLLFSVVVHVITLQAFKGQNGIKSGINQFITDLTVTDDSIVFVKY